MGFQLQGEVLDYISPGCSEWVSSCKEKYWTTFHHAAVNGFPVPRRSIGLHFTMLQLIGFPLQGEVLDYISPCCS